MQNICITFIQRRPNVFDVGPTLYKCYTDILCLLSGYDSLIGKTIIIRFYILLQGIGREQLWLGCHRHWFDGPGEMSTAS